MAVRASIQRVQGLLLNFLCGCICVSLVLVDDALKATQIKQVGDLGWEAVCYRIMDSRHCRVWVFMSHHIAAEPIAKRVDSELKKCIASTARRCKPGFWKMEDGRPESSPSEPGGFVWLSSARSRTEGLDVA
jgi:hypothetical protein